MATETQALTLSRLRGWLALLPVRIDDRRFWICAAIGVLLREAVLQGTWLPLREAMAGAVAQTLSLMGTAAQLTEGPAIAIGAQTIGVTVRCSHIEVFALVVPLLWDRSLSGPQNLWRSAALGGGLFVMGVLRIDLSIALYLQGVAWPFAHDLLLGLCYFAVLAPILHRGAWTGTQAVAPSMTAP
jgi:hypothetical protein